MNQKVVHMIKLKDLLIVQVIVWIGFTIVDWIEEIYAIHSEMEMCSVFSTIVVILYFIKRKLNWSNRQERMPIGKRMKRFGVISLRWLLLTVSTAIIITILAFDNKWIVSQDQVGLEHILNGVEYGPNWRAFNLNFQKTQCISRQVEYVSRETYSY